MITRRGALLGAASAAAVVTPIASLAQQAVQSTGLDLVQIEYPLVDIHCHIFNSSDIPGKQFLLRSYFHMYGDDDVPAGCVPEKTPGWAQVFGPLLVWLIKQFLSGAPLAADEAQMLRALNAAGKSRSLAEGRSLGDGAGGRAALQKAFVESKASPRSLDNDFESDEQREAFARFLLEQAKIAPPPGGAAAYLETAEGSARTFDGLVGENYGRSLGSNGEAETPVGRFLDWGERLSGPRADLADRLSSLYGGPANKVRLHTPALIDYSYWLDEQVKSDLSQQADVMEQITIYFARNNNVLFHGYMAYDPLRETIEGGALERVKKAVLEQGFVGAKVYPPMGFKAAGNAADPTITLPEHVIAKAGNGQDKAAATQRIKTAIDANLEALYAWCAPNKVPILSHAYDSYGAGPCFGRRADPFNWGAVVEKHKDLRVCLGHLGEFQQAVPKVDGPPKADWSKLPQTWEWHFGEMVERGIKNGFGQHLYADMSYFSDVLHDEGPGDVKRAWVEWIKRFSFLPQRLVYGSDWILIDQEKNKSEHLSRVHAFIAEVFADAGYNAEQRREMLRDVFSRNAVRFLGVDPSKIDRKKPDEPNAASRLLAFHKKNNLRPACRSEGRETDCNITFLDQFRL